jgi:micrococcal nuclease
MASIVHLTQKDVPLFSFEGVIAPAKVVRIIDGDTIHIVIEYEGKPIRLVCRLHGIDTPELSKSPDIAKRARNRLAQLITDIGIDIDDFIDTKTINERIDGNNKLIHVEFMGKEKYGRELVRLNLDDSKSVNDILVNEGYAHLYDGGKKQEWV